MSEDECSYFLGERTINPYKYMIGSSVFSETVAILNFLNKCAVGSRSEVLHKRAKGRMRNTNKIG